MKKTKLTWELANQLISEHTKEVSSDKCHAEPLVSVCMITYNHHKFIKEAIDSVIAQKTDFPIEFIIGDDCSTDGTTEIVLEYQKQYPEIIRVLLAKERLGKYTGTGRLNGIRVKQSRRGKYIALLEGDDYWTDSTKLQKQVDFLERNPEASGCFHDCITVDENGEPREHYFKVRQYQQYYTQQECLTKLRSSYNTASLMFCSSVLTGGIPSYFLKAGSDFLLDLVITEYGTLNYLPFIGSAYRIHSGGIWQGISYSEQHLSMLGRLEVLAQDVTMASRYMDQLSEMMESRIRLYWQALKAEGIEFRSRFQKCVMDINALTLWRRLQLFSTWEISLKQRISSVKQKLRISLFLD